MADDRFSAPLQESILTLLAFDSKLGSIAAGLLTPDHFDMAYREIGSRILDYRHRYGKPPGDAHIDDVFDDVLSNTKHRDYRSWQTILMGLIDQSKHLNAEYIFNRVNEFARKQTIRAALLSSSERYQAGGEGTLADVERILFDALKAKPDSMDLGTFLNDKNRVLQFLDNPTMGYTMGIAELDRRGINLTKGQLLVFIAVKGGGKSWFLIHCGKNALLQGARTLHVTLEMPEQQVAQRYMQALFSVAKRKDKFDRTKFDLDDLGRLQGFEFRTMTPALALSDTDIRSQLSKKIDHWGKRFGRLVIKKFSTGSLTVQKLESYLDMLELSAKFIPDIVLLDYPDLMKIPGGVDHHRLGLGELYKDLRGLADSRNFALGVPSQASRAAMSARMTTGQFVAEDFSKLQTADIVLTYSQTASEHELNLARLYVDKARNDEDKFLVLVAQNYKTGQFVIDSLRMSNNNNYWDLVKEEAGSADPED